MAKRGVAVLSLAAVGALILWFIVVPLLGWMIYDWGRFLVAIGVAVALYACALGIGLVWVFRERDSDS